MEALRDAINKEMRKHNVRALRNEGTPNSGWMLLDYDSVIVHIFDPRERQYYQFDDLWGNAQMLVRMQ
jgi:ribosome-associated protein